MAERRKRFTGWLRDVDPAFTHGLALLAILVAGGSLLYQALDRDAAAAVDERDATRQKLDLLQEKIERAGGWILDAEKNGENRTLARAHLSEAVLFQQGAETAWLQGLHEDAERAILEADKHLSMIPPALRAQEESAPLVWLGAASAFAAVVGGGALAWIALRATGRRLQLVRATPETPRTVPVKAPSTLLDAPEDSRRIDVKDPSANEHARALAEALAASREALYHHHRIASRDPAHRPMLSRCLVEYSVLLRRSGAWLEALDAGRDAARLWHELAQEDADFEKELAFSLTHLSRLLAEGAEPRADR